MHRAFSKTSFLIGLLAFFGLFSAKSHAQESFILRVAESDELSFTPTEKELRRLALEGLERSARVEILKPGAGGATHLLEATPAVSMLSNKLEITKFDDANKLISLAYTCKMYGSIDLSVTEIESGRIIGQASIIAEAEQKHPLETSYEGIQFLDLKKYSPETSVQHILAQCKSRLGPRMKKKQEITEEAMVKKFAPEAPNSVFRLFRFRVEAVEATKIDGDEALEVRLKAGTEYDLQRGSMLNLYAIREIPSGQKVFEKAEPLAHVNFKEDALEGGIFTVGEGKKQLLAALLAKKKVWASYGPNPQLEVRAVGKMPTLAVASLILPEKASAKSRDRLRRKLRTELFFCRNIELLDRQKLAAIDAERENLKSDEFIEKAQIDQYRAVGADLLLEIKFSEPKISASRSHSSHAAEYVKALLNFQQRLILTETGEVLAEETGRAEKLYMDDRNALLLSQFNTNPSQSLDDFFYDDAVASAAFGINSFLASAIPPRIVVHEVSEIKKGGAEIVLVVGDFEYADYDKYRVVRKRIIDVDGQKLPRFEEIGTIALRNSAGPGVAWAKVKKGDEEILAAMQAREQLFVVDKLHWTEKLTKWSDERAAKFGY